MAFRAVIDLLEKSGQEDLIDHIYDKAKAHLADGTATQENFIKAIYDQYSYQEISEKIAEIVRPFDLKAELAVIYQTVEKIGRASCRERV